MEVITIFTTRMVSGPFPGRADGVEPPGACTLNIYNDDGGQPKVRIPMRKIVAHGQLAGTQLNLTHWPKPVDKSDVSSVRLLTSCRQTLDLSRWEQANAWLKTLDRVQLDGIKNVIIAHNHTKGETARPSKPPTWYVQLVNRFLAGSTSPNMGRLSAKFLQPRKWPRYRYKQTEMRPPCPTTYACVKGGPERWVSHPSAHIAAARAGRIIELKVEGNNICLANVCSPGNSEPPSGFFMLLRRNLEFPVL